MKTDLRLTSVNECFVRFAANASSYIAAIGKKVNSIDEDICHEVTKKIPALLKELLGPSYFIKGSVGAGLLTRTPWIAIMDKEITTSTQRGVYIVFLFSTDLSHVYLTLNQGTTVPGKFGVRLNKEQVIERRNQIRNSLHTTSAYLQSCNDKLKIADNLYREGAIYFTEWNYNAIEDKSSILNEYLNIYKKYKGANVIQTTTNVNLEYRNFITAIKSKPFILLAGISGTGKSRIVRELARSCYDEGSEEFQAHKPANFEMIQVRPNWHDSTELLGYVSRINGEKYIPGDFLRFIAKAWENLDRPHFLCLDEMNLAPVEQYFAEYLSVIESRKRNGNGRVVTDPIVKKNDGGWYQGLVNEITKIEKIRTQFINEGISIPQNLIVMGTVNMDETTFSFSRKVLDRAMSIEMNHVDLYGGLTGTEHAIGKLSATDLIGTAVEGKDVYATEQEVCDMVLEYLKILNEKLDGTPFKIAYRTRNEFLLYVVNNLSYVGETGSKKDMIATALDEITSMKVLSRIEGDESKLEKNFLQELGKIIKEELGKISGKEYTAEEGAETKEADEEAEKTISSVSLKKLAEMEKKLKNTGYTSYWS